MQVRVHFPSSSTTHLSSSESMVPRGAMFDDSHEQAGFWKGVRCPQPPRNREQEVIHAQECLGISSIRLGASSFVPSVGDLASSYGLGALAIERSILSFPVPSAAARIITMAMACMVSSVV